MAHLPIFYTLNADGKRQYLLKKADELRLKGKFDKANKYYEEAKQYCKDDAQKQPNENNTTPHASPNPKSTKSLQASQLSQEIHDANLVPTLSGSYFPNILGPPTTSPLSSPSVATSSQETSNCAINDISSTFDLANRFRITSEDERMQIYTMIQKVIQQYNEDFNSKEYIQELTTLAAIPDQKIFIAIITQLLKVEKDSPTFPEVTIYGLAVVLTCAPKEIDFKDRQGLLTDILERLQFRLESTRAENNDQELLPLLKAISALFDAMLCRKLRHLAREDVYNPIKDRLTELGSDSTIDPEASFLARYAIQSLAYIGNDESLAMSVYRRGRLAIGIIVDIKSAVLDFNIGAFDSIYEKVMSMSDVSIKMKWYQGLLFLDCLLGNEDLQNFEKYILHSQLRTDEDFIQGVCLRLVQLASTHSNQQVSLGAFRLLKDLETTLVGNAQAIAQLALDQMQMFNDDKLQSLCPINPQAPVSTTNIPQHVIKYKLLPVWNKAWYSDTHSFLLKSVQDTLKQRSIMLNVAPALTAIGDDLKRIAPTSNTVNEVNKALMDHYSSKLNIRRVSGELLSLESCYVNLAIVEAESQRKKEEQEKKKLSKAFIRMPSYEKVSNTNTDNPITLDKILDKRRLLGGNEGVPKRILIVGRAGVGKTTFCKKLVHTFQSGLWSKQFDAILWLPLHILQDYKPRDLEQFLIEKYFTDGVKNKREGLAHEFIKSAEDGRILFVLDGLDEFVTGTNTEVDSPLRNFLEVLLRQTHVIITTRPHGNDRSLIHDIDLELETVGFSTENVKQYVESVISNQAERKSVLDFIQQTPLIQGLVNIPIQLDLICYSWKDLISTKDSTTITQLYQSIVRKLWCSDAIKTRKMIGNKLATESLVKCLLPRKVDSYMTTLADYLGYLAFSGLKNNHQIIFDHNTLFEKMDDLDSYRMQSGQSELPIDFLEEVKKSSILHTTDADTKPSSDTTHGTWNFIHLTFQEYFAALWLSKGLQSTSPLGKSSMMSKDNTTSFIQQNKYNPQYEIVWWMMAGQLEGEALESYFQLLQAAPRDLIGVRHQLLIAGCYKEAHARLSTKLINKIESELTQWLNFDIEIIGHDEKGSILGCQSVFPVEILTPSIDVYHNNTKPILQTLANRSYLTPPVIEKCTQVLNLLYNTKVVQLVINVLYRQMPVSPSTSTSLTPFLRHEYLFIRMSVARLLRKCTSLSEISLSALAMTLKDEHEDEDIRWDVAIALGSQLSLSEPVMTALKNAVQDSYWRVREAAINAIGTKTTLSEDTMNTIISSLEDQDYHVREAAAKVLGDQSTMPQSAITALISNLQHENIWVRYAAAEALGKHPTILESTETNLLSALNDENEYIREAAAHLLCNYSELSGPAIASLERALDDPDPNVRAAVATALGDQTKMSESTVFRLTAVLQDEYEDVREKAAKALGRNPALPNFAIEILCNALQDDHYVVCQAVAEALSNQTTLLESTMMALSMTLQDGNLKAKSAVALSLRNHPMLPESMVSVLVTALQDEYGRRDASKTLANQSSFSESMVTRIISTMKINNEFVRYWSANALIGQTNLSDITTTALSKYLQDDDKDLRRIIGGILGRQLFLPESVLMALVNTLNDKEAWVKESAAQAIGTRHSLSTSTSEAIFDTLGNDNLIGMTLAGVLSHSMIYLTLGNITEERIERLYKHAFFGYSCDHHVSLYIHENRLMLFSEQGFDQSEILDAEVLQKIVSAFKAVQSLGGIETPYN